MEGGFEILRFEKILLVKSILCAIYNPICKLEKKFWKIFLNVTTVKLLFKSKIQCFWVFLMPFGFKLYLKVNIHPFNSFFNFECNAERGSIESLSIALGY